MYSRSILLTLAAASIPLVSSEDSTSEGICYSYGVDFVDEGHYFIDSQSTEAFSAVSYFQGCNEDKADVLLVAPEDTPGETEFLCDEILTTPADENKLSTCPIKKNQMNSGHWLLLVLGNNGKGGQPFAWQRDLYLTVGPQVTTTFTPTVTMSVITTPTITQTDITTSTDTITVGPFSTVTMPSGTAKKIKTITPKAVTTTSTKTMTRTKVSTTREFVYTTKTVTPTCTSRPHIGKPDKPCQYSPTKIHPAALVTPTVIPQARRWAPRADRVADVEWVRARIEAAKQKREAAKKLNRRAPDAPTTTVTFQTPVSTTVTQTAAAITTTETVLQSTEVTSTIPPPTVLSGILTRTTTLPTPTKTKVKFSFTTTTTTKTYGATFTRTTTAPPAPSVTECKKQGGHYWWN
ncbi:hypothetical protein COCC4DRAFT_47719 [Bipolaris maydis ATCC 48331]|uniref:Uncharacterized protein n=2 Tax=Cochliobolus heterostrophus TaxID=5016 RepID=M2UVF3_COCH5|nr:uncharacterized protein COCC4DRAFT_47719 [Bipolaris maydis ATCC 48331]EMD91797.1 hypothetical protein COCHEDRAFT_1021628 [Bipolaris maydis C5]KAH7559585.1 hypothetical protein BM1_04522 [Bipolaris maydis]ENI08445.1 hypothetical protein COCC4DRAFT_47719 [Bipolaris maydis ATCC 48331]KAJ5027066.1 hypothetical protein J3E73DRAFT_301095 [Bipolaris maydis]KAJ5059167.1 hypothetical protein J3E74DRAFT_355956 [Bipolaris maydis]